MRFHAILVAAAVLLPAVAISAEVAGPFLEPDSFPPELIEPGADDADRYIEMRLRLEKDLVSCGAVYQRFKQLDEAGAEALALHPRTFAFMVAQSRSFYVPGQTFIDRYKTAKAEIENRALNLPAATAEEFRRLVEDCAATHVDEHFFDAMHHAAKLEERIATSD